MADEEFAELGEISLSHEYLLRSGRCLHGNGGGAVWGRSPGSILPISQYRTMYQTDQCRAAEAEDIMGHYGTRASHRSKAGLYYSPPGTSYTIVERPPPPPPVPLPQPPKPRGTYLGTNGSSYRSQPTGSTEYRSNSPSNTTTSYRNTNNTATLSSHTTHSHKKGALSPEQVLKMLTGGSKSADSSTEHHHPRHRRLTPPDIDQLPVRTITMNRSQDANHGFGICVKGGANNPDGDGVGVYISRVEEGSIAERAGLRPGDSILQVNGIPFNGISHEEALKMLKSNRELSMTVRSPSIPPPAQGGRTHPNPPAPPPAWTMRQAYSWIDRQGRPCSPPLDYAHSVIPMPPPPPPPPRWNSYSARSSKDKVRKVELNIEPGQSLGLMIRGGVEYNLGIFITGVDKDSVAERAGLLIGDEILEVNGQSFLQMTHDDAVNELKLHKRMTLTVRDVGKVPHSCTGYEPDTSWDIHHGALRSGSSSSAALQMVEEKARVMLKKAEFTTLTYYLDEYSNKQMSVESLVTVLLQLLNNRDKHTLLIEIRETISPEDLSKFDELVYRRDNESLQRHAPPPDLPRPFNEQFTENSVLLSPSIHSVQDLHDPFLTDSIPLKFPVDSNLISTECDDYRTPSEDSGLGLGPTDFSNNRSGGGGGRNFTETQWSLNHLANKRLDFDEDSQEFSDLDTAPLAPGPPARSRMRPSLTDMNMAVAQRYSDDVNLLAHKLGRNVDMSEDQELLEGDSNHNRSLRGDHCSSSNENEARVISEVQGQLRITVKKSRPLLGMAIEGGANTKHPLPRIINIHEKGAAFLAGGLEVGQLILEVNGVKLEGMQHQEIARLIAESFSRNFEIEFLVLEAKKSNLEPKPTALIFMES
uniref:Whirlin n=1 Tax=Cacopsylla melanoneura TaxID=428564 RepID=A0A8D8LVQ5_9HEMI